MTTPRKKGIKIEGLSDWKHHQSGRTLERLGSEAVSHYFCIAYFFEGDTIRFKGEVNRAELQVTNARATKGYVIVNPNHPIEKDPKYMERINNIRGTYEDNGAKVIREFAHHDTGCAGFLWETSR